ncbi:MAG TPA: hypothetical protein ENJ06_04595 [Phycisphaeraceae bacterium]|nr:hypothetical protein [Phycisphaeraceae bacterium]
MHREQCFAAFSGDNIVYVIRQSRADFLAAKHQERERLKEIQMQSAQNFMRGCSLLLAMSLLPLSLSAGEVSQSATPVRTPMLTDVQIPRTPKAEPVLPSLRYAVDPTRTMLFQIFDPVDEDALRIEDEQQMAKNGLGRLRTGVVEKLSQSLSLRDDAWQKIPVGRLWTAGVVCVDAKAVRVRFTDVNMPAGAELWVYAPKYKDFVQGPFTGTGPLKTGEFWSTIFPGDTVYIEYFVPDSAQGTGSLNIESALHMYRSPFDFAGDGGGDDVNGRDCHLDVMCYPDWHPLHNATVKLEFVDGGSSYLCSGTLMNTQAGDLTPYVLTANHCIDNDAAAASIAFRWFYQTTSCDHGFGSGIGSDYGTLLWHKQLMDDSLVMAEGLLPDGLTWAGWDTGTVANGTDVVGIHHPAGQRKKISFGTRITHPFGNPTNYHGVTWTAGTIEGGSSGSGLYRADNQLYIGTASHSEAPLGCTNPDGPSGYGRFDVAYTYISSYMNEGPEDEYDSMGQTNDTCVDAPLLTGGDYNGMVLKSVSDDWYGFVVPDGDPLEVTLDFTNSWGDIDMELYDSCGGSVIASSATTNDQEYLTVTNNTGATQVYYLHVYLSSDVRNQYDMSVIIGEYVPPVQHQLVQVPITQAAKDDDPTLEVAETIDLQIVINGGDDWTSTDATATVDGTFYQHPTFDADIPQTGFWPAFPSLEFDSFFSARDFAAPGFAQGPDNTDNAISAIWFDTEDTGDGTYTIARYTVTSGTLFAVSGTTTARNTQGELLPFSLQMDINFNQDCSGDLNGDGVRDQADLGILLASYGIDAGGDIDGDGDTDQADLGALLAVYGVPCP